MVFVCAKVGVYQIGKMMAKCCQICKPSVFVHSCTNSEGGGAKHQINHTNHNIQQRQSKTKHTRPHRGTHTIHNAKENSRKPNNANLPKLPKNRQTEQKIQW